MLRNFGTQDGELYKPDSMEMGGGSSNSSSMSKSSSGGFKNMTPPSGDAGTDSKERPSFDGDFDPSSMPDMGDFDPDNMPGMGDFNPGDMPDMENFDPGSMPDMGDFNPDDMTGRNKPDNGNETGRNKSDGDNETDKNSDSEDKSRNENGADSKKSVTGEENQYSESDGNQKSKDKEKSGSSRKKSGGFSMGGGGANLNYTDDDLDSYSTIWDGEITGTSKADHRRVVTALKNISEGNNLEDYLDIDNVLKYMAVHTFSVNMDSLSGSMAHNYYLYEYDGKLNFFPWDYNLSFGGMNMGGGSSGATDMVNDAIDTPFAGTRFFDAILENEEYLEKYHEYLRILCEEYVEGGRLEEFYSGTRSRIDELVKEDPTAFYSGDEYEVAAETLKETVKLRAESILGQLNEIIPSTDEGQKEDSSSFVDASHIDVKVMGTFSMGGGFSKSKPDTDKTKTDLEPKMEEKEESVSKQGTDDSDQKSSEPKMDSYEEEDSEQESNVKEEEESPDGPGINNREEMNLVRRGGRPQSFNGMPMGISITNTKDNLKKFGIYFGIMLAALIVAFRIKRR
ncbi:MAG: CotH kinase family protein [Lachnospiraceae bacterium]|nr:CotH kinase family protein [Lachnospiraceae bacterium]